MNEPFDIFYKRKHPDKCQLCLGGCKLRETGYIGIIEMPCPFCENGFSDAPLFTDEDSTAFDEWYRKRKTDHA